MYAVTQDLRAELTRLLDDHLDEFGDPVGPVLPSTLVVIEQHPDYPGELVFQVVENPNAFYSRYRDWVSPHLVLSELFNLPSFIDRLCADGWSPVFGPSAEPVLANMMRWMAPLEIEGYTLHPFQQFGLNRAFETPGWFWNWSTGAGKSFISAVGAKELFARGQIDLVIACTVSKSKENLRRFFEGAGLDAVINDGEKGKRRKGYLARHQCYVANYEKLNFDRTEIRELIEGRRVLWVFDECHKLITADDKPNLARLGFHSLRRACAPGTKVWPMSASVVNGNPLRFRDVWNLMGSSLDNPLGSKGEFVKRYANQVKRTPMQTRTGKTFELISYDWNTTRLMDIRHRVGSSTQAVRKTDPGVRELFRGLQTIVEKVQPSREELDLAEVIIDKAAEAYRRGETLVPFYQLLRCTANIPAALLHTKGEVGLEMVGEWGVRDLVAKASSSKLEAVNEKMIEIRDQGDQAVLFTHWTNMSLFLLDPLIEVPHVVHHGEQTNRESQAAQDQFKADPDITCFLTSDAGMHGLNFQNARFVLQMEPTYSYDDGMQRSSRIDRSDSHLDGLTNFVFLGEGTVDERVWSVQNARRLISAATQGTEEGFSYGDEDRERALRSEAQNTAWLLFGDRR